MIDEQAQELSADDLALVPDMDDDGQAKDTPAPANGKDDSAAKDVDGGKPGRKGTIATGDEDDPGDAKPKPETEVKPAKAALADVQDWRKEIAEHHAAGDKKAYTKELKRLEGISDPKAIWGMYRELESRFTSGGLIKIPGKDAKPEDVQAFNKALGVPEKPDEYTKDLTLENGAVVGEVDKPYVDSFAEYMHKANARPAEFKAALNWYYAQQEANAARMDEEDEEHQRESIKALKEDYGPSYDRRIRSIGSIFASAPGGADANNEKSVYARLMGGRTADGRLIGNDPDIIRWFDGLRGEINPAASVVEDGDQSGKSIEDEIKAIEKIMREDRKTYNRDYANRYAELLAVREKVRARA